MVAFLIQRTSHIYSFRIANKNILTIEKNVRFYYYNCEYVYAKTIILKILVIWKTKISSERKEKHMIPNFLFLGSQVPLAYLCYKKTSSKIRTIRTLFLRISEENTFNNFCEVFCKSILGHISVRRMR